MGQWRIKLLKLPIETLIIVFAPKDSAVKVKAETGVVTAGGINAGIKQTVVIQPQAQTVIPVLLVKRW